MNTTNRMYSEMPSNGTQLDPVSLYQFLEIVSTTLIFICFVVFQFKITSSQLLGYVIFCQITIAEINYCYSFINDYILYHVSSFSRVSVQLVGNSVSVLVLTISEGHS